MPPDTQRYRRTPKERWVQLHGGRAGGFLSSAAALGEQSRNQKRDSALETIHTC